MTGLMRIDGAVWRFAGKAQAKAERYYTSRRRMEQTSLTVTPLSTSTRSSGRSVALTVSFHHPLAAGRPGFLSRPASYVSFALRSLDGRGIMTCSCISTSPASGAWIIRGSPSFARGRKPGNGWRSACRTTGSRLPEPFRGRSPDRLGEFYLGGRKSDRDQGVRGIGRAAQGFRPQRELTEQPSLPESPAKVADDQPVMALVHDFGRVADSPAANGSRAGLRRRLCRRIFRRQAAGVLEAERSEHGRRC